MSRAEVVEHFVPVHSELEHKTVEHFDPEHKTAEHMDPGPLQKLPNYPKSQQALFLFTGNIRKTSSSFLLLIIDEAMESK